MQRFLVFMATIALMVRNEQNQRGWDTNPKNPHITQKGAWLFPLPRVDLAHFQYYE